MEVIPRINGALSVILGISAALVARKLPTFAAIRAFEAAGRHLNLQAAAKELLVSPSAISHQVSSLEAHIGSKLFTRQNNRFELTETGAEYLKELSDSLDRLEYATQQASEHLQSNQVTLNLPVSLAQLWLIPRLPDFQKKYPDADVRLVTHPEEVDFSGSDIDLAIRWRTASSIGRNSVLLFEETKSPVCSFGYLQKNGPITGSGDIAGHRLISCSFSPNEWSDWFVANGMPDGIGENRLEVDTRAAALQAAHLDIGIAMAPRPTAEHLINRGHLVLLPVKKMVSECKYSLLIADRARSRSIVRKFSNWLHTIAAETAM